MLEWFRKAAGYRTVTAHDYVYDQLVRVFEIAGAYTEYGFHLTDDVPEEDMDNVAALLLSIGFNDSDPNDISAMVAAKCLVSLYGSYRACLSDPEAVDTVWSAFVQQNALNRSLFPRGKS